MQIAALVQVINYLKEKAADPALSEGYKSLTEAVREASKSPNGESSARILKEKERLKDLLLACDPGEWSYADYSLFEKMNTGKLLGRSGAEYLDRLITPEGMDFNSVYNELNKKTKLFSRFSDNINKFAQLYDQMIPDEDTSQPVKNDKSSIFLYFEGRLSVHNVTDLERYSGLWDSILSVFSNLNGEPKPELDINSYHDGKIILEVSPGEKTISSLMAGTLGVLSLLPVILKVRNIQLELIPLPLSNSVNDLLEQEIQSLINITSFEKANKLVISHFSKASDPDEIAGELARALKQIFSFIEKGGKIEFKPLEAVQEAINANKDLACSYAIARELEQVAHNLNEEIARKEEMAGGNV